MFCRNIRLQKIKKQVSNRQLITSFRETFSKYFVNLIFTISHDAPIFYSNKLFLTTFETKIDQLIMFLNLLCKMFL